MNRRCSSQAAACRCPRHSLAGDPYIYDRGAGRGGPLAIENVSLEQPGSYKRSPVQVHASKVNGAVVNLRAKGDKLGVSK